MKNYYFLGITYIIFCVSIIYWDINRYNDKPELSKCHNAEILMYHNRPMCSECKLFCDKETQ